MADTDALAETRVRIPYRPRPHFLPFHASDKRFMFVVAHRRAGKTVALVNQLIRAANLNPRQTPPPRYAYIGPSFDAAKDLVWGYLKHYTADIPSIRTMEGELCVTLPNGAQIRLYGGALAYERMRGIYLDGAVLDEYPLLHPNAFTWLFALVSPTTVVLRLLGDGCGGGSLPCPEVPRGRRSELGGV